jgi:hypothetical protein
MSAVSMAARTAAKKRMLEVEQGMMAAAKILLQRLPVHQYLPEHCSADCRRCADVRGAVVAPR